MLAGEDEPVTARAPARQPTVPQRQTRLSTLSAIRLSFEINSSIHLEMYFLKHKKNIADASGQEMRADDSGHLNNWQFSFSAVAAASAAEGSHWTAE